MNYFLPPNALCVAGGSGLFVNETFSYSFGNQIAFLHPARNGQLGSIFVMSLENRPEQYEDAKIAYTRVFHRVISEISLRYDQFARVVHSVFFSIPSGAAFFEADNFAHKKNFKGLGNVANLVPDDLAESEFLFSKLCRIRMYILALSFYTDHLSTPTRL